MPEPLQHRVRRGDRLERWTNRLAVGRSDFNKKLSVKANLESLVKDKKLPHYYAEVGGKKVLHVVVDLAPVGLLDAPGQPFHDPAADRALFEALEQTFRPTANRRLIRRPNNINDPAFADTLVENFLEIVGPVTGTGVGSHARLSA